MPAPGKCPDGLRRRALRLVLGALWPIRVGLGGVSGGSTKRLGINPETLRGWDRVEPGSMPARGPAPPGVEAQRLRELEKEVRELGGGGRDPLGRVGFSPVVECERPSR